MSRISALCFYSLLLIWTKGLCQTDTLKLFYDSDWKQVADSDKAEYKRIAYIHDIGYWQVIDYYSSGQVQMKGAFLDKEMKRQRGLFEWFYPNGQLKKRTNYLDGRPIDESFEYYENGQLDTYVRYDASGNIEESKFYKEDGTVSVVENPDFPGGITGLYHYLSTHIKYPKALRKRGVTGKVFVTFVVHTDGSLQDVRILDSPHEALSEAALKVISSMPKWKPGSRDSKLVRVKYNLPISFKLD